MVPTGTGTWCHHNTRYHRSFHTGDCPCRTAPPRQHDRNGSQDNHRLLSITRCGYKRKYDENPEGDLIADEALMIDISSAQPDEKHPETIAG